MYPCGTLAGTQTLTSRRLQIAEQKTKEKRRPTAFLKRQTPQGQLTSGKQSHSFHLHLPTVINLCVRVHVWWFFFPLPRPSLGEEKN